MAKRGFFESNESFNNRVVQESIDYLNEENERRKGGQITYGRSNLDGIIIIPNWNYIFLSISLFLSIPITVYIVVVHSYWVGLCFSLIASIVGGKLFFYLENRQEEIKLSKAIKEEFAEQLKNEQSQF